MSHNRRWGVPLVICVLLLSVLVAAPAPAQDHPHEGFEPDATPAEGLGNPSFNESSGCGQPATSNPRATQTGFLPDGELVRGFKSDFFGRSIGDIKSQLVDWVVPMSGGFTIKVHPRALPAFELVAANLAVEQADGNYYAIRPEHTYGYAARTVSGSHALSNHALGTTIDINTTTNPYRGDNVLVTDMPDWFVAAWTDAGFCWGGSWNSIKDPMHYSWMGPEATPGYGPLPPSQPTATTATPFGGVAASYDVVFGAVEPDSTHILADATGNGLADLVRISDETYGTKLDMSRTHRRHEWCAGFRYDIVGIDVAGRIPVLGDYEGFGRLDLWLLDVSGSTLSFEVVLRSEGFDESVVVETAIPVTGAEAFFVADHERDGVVDLFVVRGGPARIEVWSGSSDYTVKSHETALPVAVAPATQFATGDRDLDDLPDVYVVDGPTVSVLGNGYGTVDEQFTVGGISGAEEIGISDFDGDGRDDLFALHGDGTLDVHLGNSPLPGATSLTSWFVPSSWVCDPSATLYDYTGLFRDDDGSVHEGDIDLIGREKITVGCNPPVADHYCPKYDVTRGQMAAFLVRALGLAEVQTDVFVDDDDSIFAGAIDALAAAGITQGCNPPENDRFCPEQTVTRGEMAAFLVRAFDLPKAAPAGFVDTTGSVFSSDIDALAAAGITKGCNPPSNNRYCPGSAVSREQMASFLIRALSL